MAYYQGEVVIDKQMFAVHRAMRFSILFLISVFWVACKPNDLEFQAFQPKSETALADLFNNTPAIRAAFTTVEPHEFNNRLDNLMRFNPAMGVKTMHALGVFSHTTRPGTDGPPLPLLADNVSDVVNRFAQFYQATPARQAEYNAAIDLVNRLLDIDPKAITDGTYALARGVRYLGNDAQALFPLSHETNPSSSALTYRFPALTTWKTCDDVGSVFLNSKPVSHATDLEGRDALWGLYDMLRTAYCIYANRSGPRVFIADNPDVVPENNEARVEAVVSNTGVVDYQVLYPGFGYTTTPNVTIDAAPGPGGGATAIASIGPIDITVTGGRVYFTSNNIVRDITTYMTVIPADGYYPAYGTGVIGVTALNFGSGYVIKNDATPGAFMRNLTAIMKNSGDIELRIRNLIDDLNNKIADYSEMERNIVDWTVNESTDQNKAQIGITNYLINHVYPITRKDFVFDTGKEVLDREAEHLSLLNPGGSALNNDQYLTEWLLKSLYNDAEKIDDLENFTEVDTSSALYKFGREMVHNPTYGLNNVTGIYSKASLRNLLWTGSNYTCNCGSSQNFLFRGLLENPGSFSNSGYITKLGMVKSTQNTFNSYRNYMGTRVNSLVTVPSRYNNEFFLESALKNFYYHVLERYYDQSSLQWALTPEDAQISFNDPERNLQSYIGQMQYSMRNMAILDRTGKSPGEGGFNNVPYLTEFLYTIAAANGYVDPDNAPAQLTLKTCLNSMGAADIAADGIRTINIDLVLFTVTMNAQVTNFAMPADGKASSSRNDQPYSASLGMFAFELLSPGRFIPRVDTDIYASDTTNGKFRGRFSPHQGDIESTGLKTSNWMAAEFALSAWEGYGPYSVRGRAANGSNVKYENDYYTDGYRSRIATDFETYTETAMGTNGGTSGSIISGNGNYHIYERIYRPRNAGDSCWSDSTAGGYSYPRYGYIRPEGNTSYWNENNCGSWEKVRIDFDTRDEAIRANVEWNLKFKKYIFVIPMFGYTAQDYLIVHPGASFAVFSTIHGNGLWGVTTGKRSGTTPNFNGRWNKSSVNMSAGGNGMIPNSGNGFVDETPAGGQPGISINKTRRMGVQSYTAGDSMVLLEMTMNSWHGASLLVDLNEQIWDSLGNGPVTPAMIMDNFDSVLTLAEAVYRNTDVLSGGFNGTETNISKFRRFFDTFFPTDETICSGGVLTNRVTPLNPGDGGYTPDLFENYLNGCGVTARDLPPVPKVNPNTATCNEFVSTSCFRYPNAYDANGNITGWYIYRGPSDGKLTGMLTPLIMLFGTMHEDGAVIKVTGNGTDNYFAGKFATRYNGSLMAANENRDSVTIRNFCSDGEAGCPSTQLGYRVELNTLFDGLAALNETKKNNANNLPQYHTTVLSNILTETAPGLRNGFVPKMTNNKYANVAYIDPLIRDLESLIADNVRNAENRFEVTTAFAGTGGIKNKDRLRYFSTKNVINPSIAVTVKTGTPAYISAKNHGLEVNDKIRFTATGALPAGIAAATDYYVISPITADNFRISATPCTVQNWPYAPPPEPSFNCLGVPVNASSTGSGVSVQPQLFTTNRFNASVNGTPLNGIPINMMKQFVAYLRSLTSDADIVAAIKAAVPMLNDYLEHVQGTATRISLTDEDIDHIVSFLRDTNISGDYSIDSFLDMLVATKMDDLNTLRSFNFDQFKTLGSYQVIFDDMNDKINKYFEIDIKKDILYSSLMLGEPTCPGGSANGFYDHNGDGVWNPGTFTFISAAYAGATTYTDTANVNGTCTIVTQVPNIYDKDYYMFDMGGVARNLERKLTTTTSADIDNMLYWLYGRAFPNLATKLDIDYGPNPKNAGKVECFVKDAGSGGGINFDFEIKAFKNVLLCDMYRKKLDEPHYDRNGDNIIGPGEFTDINGNAVYDDKNSASVVTLREMITYYLEGNGLPQGDPNRFLGFRGFYDDYKTPNALSPNKNYIHFAAQALPDLLSPSASCDAQGLNCSANPKYLTAELLAARKTFYNSTQFTSAELLAIKNVIGNFLYDSDTGTYTRLLERVSPHLVTVLREFQGDYNELLDMGIEGFKPDGFMTYFSTNLKNQAPYASLDILSDVRTLFNTQTMRCYPGVTKEYYGGPAYCKKYRALDTFWGQFGLLMDQFSTSAYNKYKAQWQSQVADPYYARLVAIFE